MSYQTQQTKRPVSTSAVVRIVLWSLVLAILLGLFALFMWQSSMGKLSWSNFSLMGGYHYDDADEYSVGGGTTRVTVTEIDVDWLAGQVNILPTDGDAVEIKEDYTGEDPDYRLRWRVEDGELSVKYQAPGWSWSLTNGDRPEKNLTVLVPVAVLEQMDEVSVESVGADVTYTGNARELSLDAVEGTLAVTGTVGKLDIDAVEGELTFRGTVDRLDMDGVEWRAVVYLDRGTAMDLDGVETDMTLYLSDAVTGFRLSGDGLSCHHQINGFDGVRQDGDKNAAWGDESLTVRTSGVSTSLTVEKMDSQPVLPPDETESTPEN